MDVTSILEVNHVKIKCYVIGLCVMFTYAFISHFMDFVYSLMNECVNQSTVILKDNISRSLWHVVCGSFMLCVKQSLVAVSNSLVC